MLSCVTVTLLSIFTSPSTASTQAPTLEPTESPTGAVLYFDEVVDGPLYHQFFPVAPAQFGYHKFGGQLEGVLILPASPLYHKECPPDDCLGVDCFVEPVGVNPYIKYIHDWFIEENDIKNYIIVIDRLDCYFVDKIEFAQQLGASGVIICDWQYEGLFTMWMPQDWSDDITIPSVLLQMQFCDKLMAHMGVINWDPNHPLNMTYPTPEQMNWTIATIEWSLLENGDRVNYELWTSSNDHLGSKFKHHFNTTAIELDKSNETSFTPHMYILNGTHWGCDDTVTLPCKQQCSNNGRYCAVDPEYDMSLGLDGIDVIQENLRSLCVWEYDKLMHRGTDDIMWWDYAVLWDENCGIYGNDSSNFHINCSFEQMTALDPTNGLANYVRQCIIDSGGYGYTDGVNTILKRETKLKYNSSIHSVPMVRVNGYLIHGNIDCMPPVTATTCQVLEAICSGFIDGTQPNVCYLTPSPTIAQCSDSEKDCFGVCYGTHTLDACNQCLSVSDPKWNECIGCNGQINETYDCSGMCGGHYGVNPCGYCKDTNLHNFDTFGVDCNGTCSVELKEDECGKCILESDYTWNQCVGCDGVADSETAVNPCGRCIDLHRSDFFEFGRDCAEDCDGSKEWDECNQCLETSSVDWDKCIGCDGITFSNKSFNDCGRCIDSNLPDFDNIGRDCRGLCATNTEMYAVDECGQCLLETDPEFDNCCGGNKNKGFNICGLCLWKNATDFSERGKDCKGNCEGQYVMDACGQCLLPSDTAFDECLNCGENDDQQLDCNDECGGNAKFNPCGLCLDQSLPDFNVSGQDCKGTCGGSFSIDECETCLDRSDLDWNSCIGCDGIVDSNKKVNPCGICILQTRDDWTDYGKDCAGECDGNYVMDECQNCLLQSDPKWNECIDCEGEINGENQKNDCGVCASVYDVQFNEYGKDCTGNCALTAVSTHYVDECGECLLASDTKWNECIGVDAQSGNDGNNEMIVIIAIAIGAFVLICAAFIVIVYLFRKHREMKRQFDGIREIYKPMDDMKLTKTNKRGSKTSVPDQESD